jgi:hypothetical protein
LAQLGFHLLDLLLEVFILSSGSSHVRNILEKPEACIDRAGSNSLEWRRYALRPRTKYMLLCRVTILARIQRHQSEIQREQADQQKRCALANLSLCACESHKCDKSDVKC